MEDETSRTTNVSGSAPVSGSTPLTESLDSTPEVEQHPVIVKRKAIEPRSAAWPHYDKLIEDGINKAKCKYCDGSVAGVLESDDWQKVRNMVIFLKRFYDLTEKVSGSLYVTSNGHFEDIVELHNHLRECMEDDDPSLAKMGEKMKEKFVKYWGAPEKMNKVLFIASILDPRNKLEYVGDALEDMFGDEKGSEIKDKVVT
ncbi:uncharacterized protein LOC132061583 [Lycium ferocissimum]|uniref:uncharacterized protein LOC132061583 n=1 Tax=Lycium ferocissimum TaxID=112874 RepID=UPI002814D6B7|nr:uncharacterized protein LOC132061583 [Lycium ferocissimum]